MMYFGNTDGVLEYDGCSWRLIKTPALVRSLAIDDEGVIYVGTVSDFGQLIPDDKGLLQYHSLKPGVPTDKEDFADVWHTYVIDDSVYFTTLSGIYRLRNEEISVLEPAEEFGFTHLCNGRLYVSEAKIGLMSYHNEDRHILPGTLALANTEITDIFSLKEDRLLILTAGSGLFIYSLEEERLISSLPESYAEANDFLRINLIYRSKALPDGNIAIGTLKGGLIIIAPDGEINAYFSKANGLRSNRVYRSFIDRNNMLWMSLESGISSTVYNPSYSVLTEKDGLVGAVYCVENHGGNLYVGTSQRAYKILESDSLTVVPGTERENWFLKSAGNALLQANYPHGFLEFRGERSRPVKKNKKGVGVAFCEVPDRPDLLIGVTHTGFSLLENSVDGWGISNYIDGFSRPIYAAKLDRDGNMWARCAPNNLYRLRFNATLDSVVLVEPMQPVWKGDPITTPIPYSLNDGHVVFGSDQGAYEYDDESQSFVKFPPLKSLKWEVSPIYQDKSGNIWYEETKNGQHVKGVFWKEEEGWRKDLVSLSKFTSLGMYKGPTNNIVEMDDGSLAIGTTEGLVMYQPENLRLSGSTFATKIRRILINDTLHTAKANKASIQEFNFRENNIRFEFSALYYEDSDKNTYSYRLVGEEDTVYSAFVAETFKEYSNLQEGDYVFEVRSQNLYNDIGSVASFAFTIAPPWYRTMWAYLFYISALLSVLCMAVSITSRRYRQQNERLEKLIGERTVELEKEKEKSELLSHDLLRILTIIGHDMRRPVLSFRGITKKVNYLLKKKDFERLQALGGSIEGEAQSLYQLTENLLNWGLLKQGVAPYSPEMVLVASIVREVQELHERSATKKGVTIKTSLDKGMVVFVDKRAVFTILRNLVDNAIKYTPTGGQVFVHSQQEGQLVILKIADTGIGISPERRKILFDKKQTTSERGTAGEVGTGIGLSLCQELAEINKGSLSVMDNEGQGTTFTLTLPTQ